MTSRSNSVVPSIPCLLSFSGTGLLADYSGGTKGGTSRSLGKAGTGAKAFSMQCQFLSSLFLSTHLLIDRPSSHTARNNTDGWFSNTPLENSLQRRRRAQAPSAL